MAYAVEARHPNVHQEHVWPLTERKLDSALAIGGLADYLYIGLRLDNPSQASPDQFLVVCDRHSNDQIKPILVSAGALVP